MNGEGTYFNTKGENIEGIFSKSKIIIDGVPIDAFKSEKERKEQYLRIVEGRVPKRSLGAELPEPSYLENSDQLVSWITEGIKHREILVLGRTQQYKGGLDIILQTLDRKRAKYMFLSARDLPSKSTLPPRKPVPNPLQPIDFNNDESLHSQEDPFSVWLYTLRDCVEDGLLLVINVDYFTSKKPSDVAVLPQLDALFNVRALGRDSAEILSEFNRQKLEPPTVIHPGYSTLFLVNLKTEKPAKSGMGSPDLSVEKTYRAYKWISQLGPKVRFGFVNELAKPPPLYQTEQMEESLNFENGLRPAEKES